MCSISTIINPYNSSNTLYDKFVQGLQNRAQGKATYSAEKFQEITHKIAFLVTMVNFNVNAEEALEVCLNSINAQKIMLETFPKLDVIAQISYKRNIHRLVSFLNRHLLEKGLREKVTENLALSGIKLEEFRAVATDFRKKAKMKKEITEKKAGKEAIAV